MELVKIKSKAELKEERKRWKEEIKREVAEMMKLPFIKDTKLENPSNGRKETQRCFWSVEPTGVFSIDEQTGQEYGLKYCEYVTRFPGHGDILGHIVSDMIKHGEFGRIEISFLYVVSKAISYGASFVPGVIRRENARIESFNREASLG